VLVQYGTLVWISSPIQHLALPHPVLVSRPLPHAIFFRYCTRGGASTNMNKIANLSFV